MILIINQINVAKMQVADTSTNGHVFSDDDINARERLRRTGECLQELEN